MEKARSGDMTVQIIKNHQTNEPTCVSREEYPPEHLMGSLSARIRPLTLKGDDLYNASALDSIAACVYLPVGAQCAVVQASAGCRATPKRRAML